MKKTTLNLVRAAVVAAVYATTTLILYPLSFGGVQVRVSEALTLLPLLMPESAIGLGIGCLIANCFGNGALDIAFGTLSTVIASLITLFIGKTVKNEKLRVFLGALPPVIVNAVVVPFTFLALTNLRELYFLNALTVFIGQAIAVYALGIPVYILTKKILKKK